MFKSISGSYDKTIHVWRFKEDYKESTQVEGVYCDFCVVKHMKTIKHHKSMITSLTYDGINCIASSNSEGYLNSSN